MENSWNFTSRSGDTEYRGESLGLNWELDGEEISEGVTPADMSAAELFSRWLKKIDRDKDLSISWTVDRVGESAPFTGQEEDFLSFYTWPRHPETGERMNWLALPVQDKSWNDRRSVIGGFIQETLGWKPSPLQRTLHIRPLLWASGWTR